MATPTTALGFAPEKISKDQLDCSICQERYKQPKLLDCGHSFCKDCLETYQESQGHTPQISCPICCQETVLPEMGIPGLKTNSDLIGMIKNVELQESVSECSGNSKLLCEICDKENKAKLRCLECARNICLNCSKTHLHFTLSSKKCYKHEEQPMLFYCMTCGVLICQACTVLDHPKQEHCITNAREAAETFRQSLNQRFPDLNKETEAIKKNFNETCSAKRMLNDKIAMARKAVQDRVAEITKQVQDEEKKLLDKINTFGQDHNKKLDELMKALTRLLQRREDSLETASNVSKNASDSDFLSRYPVINKDLEILSRLNPPKISGMLSRSYPLVMQNQGMGGINLGKLVVEDMWELHLMFGKEGSGPGEFESATGIATQPGEIAVTDWKNKRVVIYNSRGQKRSCISTTANDIAATSNGWVVVNPRTVKVYNKNNTLASEFATLQKSEVDKTNLQLESVAVKDNGNIIVGDTKRKVLTEHNPIDGSLIRTIPMKTAPNFLAVLNDRIAINNWDQGQVDVVDGNAKTIFSIKPTIRGQPVKCCRGVCCNSSGIYMYVAMDTGNLNTGHVHHYDSGGAFISCVAQGLYDPMGITITADGQQLAVADWYSVKIYHKV